MTSNRRRQLKLLLKHIDRILYESWDPIGVAGSGPADEYTTYAPRVLRRALEGLRPQELASDLDDLAEEALGLTPPDGASVRAAELLLQAVAEAGIDAADVEADQPFSESDDG